MGYNPEMLHAQQHQRKKDDINQLNGNKQPAQRRIVINLFECDALILYF